MTERPILFSAPMVRALLAGTKTQTRRVVKPQPDSVKRLGAAGAAVPYRLASPPREMPSSTFEEPVRCPYGAPGDTLWVREGHYLTDDGAEEYAVFAAEPEDVAAHLETIAGLRSSHPTGAWDRHAKLRPSIHMPRWASRITLRITDLRVERLNEISEADAKAEGIVQLEPPAHNGLRNFGVENMSSNFSPICHQSTAGRAYRFLWERINGAESWVSNPWVWAVSFERAA